jgi:hypothetical protein
VRVTIDVIKLTMQKPNWRMRRLAASDLLPERAGQPVKAWVHVSLADLLRLDGSSALLEQWTVQVRARWAARRAAASEGGGSEGAWLDGDAAAAITCDAAMAPVVTGEVDVDALDELVRLCSCSTGTAAAPTPPGPATTTARPAATPAATARPAVTRPAATRTVTRAVATRAMVRTAAIAPASRPSRLPSGPGRRSNAR